VTSVEWNDDGVTIAGLWNYAWAAKRRPFLHPVRTPAGHVLTVDSPDDHPWHHGLWFAIKYVDDDNFWEEMAPYGVVRHLARPTITERTDGSITLTGDLHWTRPDRKTVAIVEQRRLTHVPIGDDGYAIDLDTTLVPTSDVRLDRTEFTTWGGYGGLTLRGRPDLTDTKLLLADGSVHDRLTGTPSEWLDISGTVDPDGANAPAGITLFDHPGNRRTPVPWYASTRNETYGDEGWSNFVNAAFLWDGPLHLAEGEELRVRHRTLIHDGTWSVDEIEQVREGITFD